MRSLLPQKLIAFNMCIIKEGISEIDYISLQIWKLEREVKYKPKASTRKIIIKIRKVIN